MAQKTDRYGYAIERAGSSPIGWFFVGVTVVLAALVLVARLA